VSALAAAAVAACGSASASPAPRQGASLGAGRRAHAIHASTGAARGASRTGRRATRVHDSLPVDRYPIALTARWQMITTIGGRPAVWIAVRQG